MKGLECCSDVGGKHCYEGKCPYASMSGPCREQLAQDALELLKEQEAVEPIPPTDESEMWRCGNCHHQIFRCRHQRFCEKCGRQVKWE